jgi:hypothetical protein
MQLPAELVSEAISAKQVVFVLATLGFLSAAIPAAIRFPWVERACIGAILFMAINPVDVTFFSYTKYRGDIRGIEFGVIDWMVIVLIATMRLAPRWQRRRLHYRSPNQTIMAVYFAWCLLSIFTATVPQFAFFGVTRLVRAFALFWVAYNWLRSDRDLRFFIWCVVGISFYSFWQVLLDKYLRGVFPPQGSFPHQNSLATFQNVMNFIVFAALLGDTDKVFDRRSLIYWGGLGAGSITSVATLSRGGMATMIMGYALMVPLLFFLKQPGPKTRKKLGSLGVMFLASLPALAVVLPEVIKRFETAPPESAHARDVFNELASDMGGTHFFGIGLNNYSFAGAFLEYRDRLPPIDQGGLAHNIYWLHYAELGPVGATLWVAMMLGFIFYLLRFIARRGDGIERVFAIGVLAGLVVAMLIGKLEWNFRQTQLTMTYFLLAGFGMSLTRVERERQAEERRRRQLLALVAAQAQQAAAATGARPRRSPERTP